MPSRVRVRCESACTNGSKIVGSLPGSRPRLVAHDGEELALRAAGAFDLDASAHGRGDVHAVDEDPGPCAVELRDRLIHEREIVFQHRTVAVAEHEGHLGADESRAPPRRGRSDRARCSRSLADGRR